MARNDLIDAYLEDLRRTVPAPPGVVRTMVREAEDHLRDSCARHVADGVEPIAAMARAIEEFGPAELVARSFVQSGFVLPRPTRITRWAGRAGLIGCAALVVGLVLLNTSVAEVQHKPGPGDDIGWGVTVALIAAGVTLLLLAVVGMTVRLGRRLGRFGVIGNAVLIAALPLSLPFGYGGILALIGFLALGFTLLAVAAWRAGDLSRPAVALLLAGPVLAAAIVVATEVFDAASGDATEYLAFAVLPTVIGWIWMNVSLAREHPAATRFHLPVAA